MAYCSESYQRGLGFQMKTVLCTEGRAGNHLMSVRPHTVAVLISAVELLEISHSSKQSFEIRHG